MVANMRHVTLFESFFFFSNASRTAAVAFLAGSTGKGWSRTSNFFSYLRTILRLVKLVPFSLSFSRTDLSEKTFVLFEAISKLQRKTFARLDMRVYFKNSYNYKLISLKLICVSVIVGQDPYFTSS